MSLTTTPSRALVRMYNVGFGDAFLLVLPGEGRSRRVLIDCGTHFSSERPRPMKEVVAQIVEDARDADGTPRIDVVVGTHRHQDHVSGFDSKAWDEVEVTEVWMPWTEDFEDPEATRIRDEQSATAARLVATLSLLGADTELEGLARNQLTNAGAMETLHSGFAGDALRRFLPEKDAPWGRLRVPGVPNARVHVLGPARDAEQIRDMDPPAGESYLRMSGATGEEETLPSPFGPEWARTEEDLGREKLDWPRLFGYQKARVRSMSDPDLFGVTVALEKAVNGTSLMLMFELGDAFLLFTGDAQWGTWLRVLERRQARDLVRKTSFLKIGHHGSHNATPRRFVELLAERAVRGRRVAGFAAMVSTHPMPRWDKIPKDELLTALRGLTPTLARSDFGGGAATRGFAQWGEEFIDFKVPLKRR